MLFCGLAMHPKREMSLMTTDEVLIQRESSDITGMPFSIRIAARDEPSELFLVRMVMSLKRAPLETASCTEESTALPCWSLSVNETLTQPS